MFACIADKQHSYVWGQQKELVEFRQTYAEVAANTKRLEKQMVQARGLQEEWLKRAKLALEKVCVCGRVASLGPSLPLPLPPDL